MKRLPKIFIMAFVFFAIITSFSSCESFLGYDFTKQESVDKIKIKITENLPTDAIISKISFMAGSNNSLTSNMEIVTVNYYEANDSILKQIVIYTTQDKIQDKSKFIMSYEKKLKPEDGVKLSDLNTRQITSNIKKAIKLMDAENYPFSGIGTYYIIPNNNPEKTLHEFSLHSRAESNSKVKEGKEITETNYYEIPFFADGNGNVKARKD